MDSKLQEISDQQRQTWDKFSSGWNKWDDLVLNWIAPVGEQIIQGVQLKDTMQVLDIAAGTGEPGLTAASRIPKGKVVITDLSDQMLGYAAEKAKQRGIGNIETRQCDVSAMPFPDGSFDAVMCRFGFMFFPDIQIALAEMVRVAKPGARICTAIWGPPEKNPWATTIMATIAANVDMPSPPLGAPGLFRCAAPEVMDSAYQQAGLSNIVQTDISGVLEFDEPEQYWNFMTDIAAPVVAGLSKADEPTRAKIRNTVLGLAAQASTGGKVKFPWLARTICGVK
jgi:ubiquinone/menaquinone biosynthesis C-methylase UbiE